METTRSPLATAYIPQVTRRMGAIASLDAKISDKTRFRYFRTQTPPVGASTIGYDLYDEDIIAMYRKAGAMVVMH